MEGIGILRLSELSPMVHAASDALMEICEKAGDGDRAALGELFERLADELYAFAIWSSGSREVAEDALAGLFARLIAAPERLANVRAPRPYLFRAVSREARRLAARRGREVSLDQAGQLFEAVPTDSEQAPSLDLERALERLPQRQREALYLRYFAGLSLAEIGRATGVPSFTAASRCRLGVARLKRLLGAAG